MAVYRYIDLKVGIATDSSLSNGDERRIAAFQTKDLSADTPRVRVAPTDAEKTIVISNVTTPYFFVLLSDYPVKVRLNGGTQFTLTSSSVTPVNAGSPPPPQCFFGLTGLVTSVQVAPITGAAQTAAVEVIVSGDPSGAYQ